MSTIYLLKGGRIKKAQFVCGFETSVEYFDESGQSITFEEVTSKHLEEIRAKNAALAAEIARLETLIADNAWA